VKLVALPQEDSSSMTWSCLSEIPIAGHVAKVDIRAMKGRKELAPWIDGGDQIIIVTAVSHLLLISIATPSLLHLH